MLEARQERTKVSFTEYIQRDPELTSISQLSNHTPYSKDSVDKNQQVNYT